MKVIIIWYSWFATMSPHGKATMLVLNTKILIIFYMSKICNLQIYNLYENRVLRFQKKEMLLLLTTKMFTMYDVVTCKPADMVAFIRGSPLIRSGEFFWLTSPLFL